jgi:hypothetical protein
MSSKFLFSMLMCIPLQSTQQAQREKRCDKLSILAYKAMSCCLKNDYHTLAYSNACWMLKMKLKCREQMQDINRYYLRSGTIIQGKEHLIWVSPLHEAIHRGHVQAVEIRCNAGANKNLRIKSTIERGTEMAEQETGCIFIEHLNLTREQAQKESVKWYRSNYVGFSALALAKVLCKRKLDTFSSNRERIYVMLC